MTKPRPAGVRARFAFEAAELRVGDLGLRAAAFRVGMLIVVGATLVMVGAHWWAWLPVLIALVGGYLSLATNWYQVSPGVPREPLARLALRLTLRRSGRFAPDVPGTIEALSYVPVAVIGPWLMVGSPVEARLLVLGASMAWIGSCLYAVFADAAFYSPTDVSAGAAAALARVADVGRTTVLGPLAAGLAMLVVLPASWRGDERLLAGVLCACLALVQLRIRETDRILERAAYASESDVIASRHDLIDAAHELMGAPLSLIRAQVADVGTVPVAVESTLYVLESGYNDLLVLETELDRDIDWPGLLYGHLDRLRGRHQIDFELTLPPRLSRVDRTIAHQAIFNLASNAAQAGATRCTLALASEGELLVLSASDDGRPVASVGWKRERGGLQRLESRLERSGSEGRVELSNDGSTDTKLIVAQWVADREGAV